MSSRNPHWWRDVVVYQVYPRSFQDSDGDGIGDLRGIIARLDHLERLGVGVVWLSPIYVSPHRDNGYDISDYQAIDPLFGTLDDLDALIADLHRRGMRLVLDLVVNHTSVEHPWFVQSRSSLDSPTRDWYWWRPPRPGLEFGAPGAEPTNWTSFFGGPAWTADPATGQYYLHLFDPGQPDLNWEHPPVREAVYEMMRWWVARGVDGFRMDVINLISKNAALPDCAVVVPGAVNGFEFVANGPRLQEFLAEMRSAVFGDRADDYLLIGETPGMSPELAAELTHRPNRVVDMVFQFDHLDVDHGPDKFDVHPLHLPDLKAVLGRWQSVVGPHGWNSLYWCNHDQPRIVSRFGDDRHHWRSSATMLAAVLHLHRGTPFVYQGEELGMTNVGWSAPDEFDDIESRNYYANAMAEGRSPAAVLAGLAAMSRDNARTPVQWDGSANAGFTAGTPWIAVNRNATWLNAAAQCDDPDSVFNFYRRLIALRRESAVVVDGVFEMLAPDDPAVYAYVRRLGDDQLLVVANFTAGEVERDAVALGVDVGAVGSDGASLELVLGNHPLRTTVTFPLRLAPFEVVVAALPTPPAERDASGMRARGGPSGSASPTW